MSLIDRARVLRKTIEKLSANLKDEQAIEMIELFPTWIVNAEYKIGDRFRYKGVLYQVTQNHTSQSDWLPDEAVSLYGRVLASNSEQIFVWEQPGGNKLPYMIGDKVYYPTAEDSIYESTIDNNVWSPVSYPSGWNLVLE